MKRTVPLLIAAFAGYVLIASKFIPLAEKWGETEAIWFDILAAIAFVLGGGSLLKLHLRRISDRQVGWGYSAITLAAFLATLFVGIAKTGARPALQQEFYGESFADLAVADLPPSLIFRVPGTIPARADEEPLPLSVQRQLSQDGADLVFKGWMSSRQKAELAGYKEQLSWACTVDKLFAKSQPPAVLKGKADYRSDYSSLSYRGFMTDAAHTALLSLGKSERYLAAVETLWKMSRTKSEVTVERLPAKFAIAGSMSAYMSYDAQTHKLAILGPMSADLRDELASDHFTLVRPTTPAERAAFRQELESKGGPLTDKQALALDADLSKTWSLEKLRIALDEAGRAVPVEKTACELADEQANPVRAAAAPKKSGPDVELNAQQRSALEAFVHNPGETVGELTERLHAAGPFTDRQESTLQEFFSKVPTAGEQKLRACIDLLRIAPLTREQRDFLRTDYRNQTIWRQTVGDLFVAAHVTKYPWSGQYNSAGSAFNWMYEYIFKPLTATMFALLAFYVASAAFLAFRAKNLEALLLLGTAFIILLGQTFAGYWLTSWLPADPKTNVLAWLRIENLKILIMSVFTTAGTRAIMIGIALGLASTSLRILLGQDRSYLGGGD